MYLYNSATHKKEEFKTHTPGRVEMYTCGPTVYHFAHIGNLRSYIMEDVLEKFLRWTGYDVHRVMNITDVGHLTSDADEGEDKMLKGAKREHKTVMEIAQFYTDAFFEDCRKLNIKRPDVVQPATGLIDDYIRIISRLLEKGYAYVAGGNVYFDTSKLGRYYVFNDHDEEDLAVGVREGVEEDPNKRNKNDFVLWFTKSKFEDQALKWDSPWGVGYPGWHIECSGISLKYNGEYLDLHCGGVDNAFPHHTNEIAQSESYLGHPWCPQWFHVHHLNTSDGKMSKSKGNVVPPSSVIEPYGADTMRLAILFIAPPEKDFDWDPKAVEGANRFIKRAWRIVWQLVQSGDANVAFDKSALDEVAMKLYRERHRTIAKCTEDFDRGQFNTAISAVMELVNAASAYLNATECASRDKALCYGVAKDIVSVLAPICPFWADELWHEALGCEGNAYTAAWPEFDLAESIEDTVQIVVQVLGKVRGQLPLLFRRAGGGPEMQAAAEEAVAKWLEGKTVVKAICVPGKLVNLVVK